MARKLIIDTDPGIDDAMAIFLALKSPELDVIGLTTVFGNVDVGTATTNALRLLDIAGRTEIPVARGAAHPLAGPVRGYAFDVHGEDGQGNVFLPPSAAQPVDQAAAAFIIEQVMAAPGEVTLVPVGPLTNIALALRLEPRLVHAVREVVLMGGSALALGNVNPAAEANILGDPEAADVVFGAGWPLVMVGLDVTHKVVMSPEHLDAYGHAQNPLAQHIARIVLFYHAFYQQYYPGLRGIYVHDSSAIAYAIDPTLFTVEQWPVRVETQGISRGKTWPYTGNSETPAGWRERPRVGVCVDVDAERLLALERSRLM
ncbi:MAG TPA: nucleoside hydrolase [Aggregatilinea sp.]|uniref:nucleoside hydrolase n=1 Tax=Aggregatilinea sp. TaxID=2806333 RepID=UPI002D04B835|nr:nucleoside hydrolase [Aggregatilinea sp.]HML23935.1 nucleoside hydrolase [Aggregatilinea sp.]